METKPKKKLGRPVSAPGATEYNVRLNPRSADWAKGQPEGLSAILRNLLDGYYATVALKRPHDKGE